MREFILRVEKNDDIEKLENKLMLPRSYIFNLNKIEDIYEGEWLYVRQIKCIIHVVLPFETIETISEKYNVNKEEILDFNDTKEIFIGMKLFIKTKE